MGITNLNKITKDPKAIDYTNTFKANTVIIDGNNLVVNRLNAIKSSYINSHKDVNFNCANESLLKQFHYILVSTINTIIGTIKHIYNTMVNERNIIIIFDPITTAKYIIPSCYNNIDSFRSEELDLKQEEQVNRSSAQIDTYEKKKQSVISNLEILYPDDIEKYSQLYNQISYFVNDNKLHKLLTLVQNELLYAFNKDTEGKYISVIETQKESIELSNHVRFIQSISEADLIIYNFASMFNYLPVLIYSMDSDYFVLCSDLKNVYKTDITLNKPIYSTYNIWRTVINRNITYDDIICIAIMSGNDYNAKNGLITFDVEKAKALVERNINAFSRCKKIKPYLKYLEQNESLHSIIEAHSKLVPSYNHSYYIYKSREYNMDYKEFKINSYITVDYIINKIKNDVKQFIDFDNIYDDEYKIIDDPIEFIKNEHSLSTIGKGFGKSEVNANDIDIDFENVENVENVENNLQNVSKPIKYFKSVNVNDIDFD